MRKKIVFALLATLLASTLTACGASKVVHCDRCGREIKVSAKDEADDEWFILCDRCNKEIGLDDAVMDIINH